MGSIGINEMTPPEEAVKMTENMDGNFYNPPSLVDKNGKPIPVFDTSIESLSSICKKDLPPIKYFVDGMLSAGFTVLAGNPKIGKSWLVQQLAICIASGIPFLEHGTRKASVLYLDLEGSEQRTQERVKKQGYKLPDNIFVKYRCRTIDGEPVTMKDNNLVKYLDQILTELTPSPELVIIDTLIKVKGGEKRTLNSYENDSKIFGALQDYAISKGICIVGLTHLHKEIHGFSGSDWTERITGSMGLVGVGDNLWGLFKKGRGENEREAVFRIAGRDLPECDFLLNHNRDNCRWDLISNNVKQYEAETHPFFKYINSIGDLSGTAGSIVSGYLEYCTKNNLYPRITTIEQNGKPSDNATICKRFSQMIKKISPDLPLIEYQLHCKETNKGRIYSFEKYHGLEESEEEEYPW